MSHPLAHLCGSFDLLLAHSILPHASAMCLSALCFLWHHRGSLNGRGICISPLGEPLNQWKTEGSQWINMPASQLPGELWWKAFTPLSGPHGSEPLLLTAATRIKCPFCWLPIQLFASKSLSQIVLLRKRLLLFVCYNYLILVLEFKFLCVSCCKWLSPSLSSYWIFSQLWFG